MAIVSSYGKIQRVAGPTPVVWSAPAIGGGWAPGSTQSYGAIWKAHPTIRTVVEFLARNVAQLGLHVYRRVSDTDRERLYDHPLATWLRYPNPYTTRYRLINDTLNDFGIYLNAFWLKVRLADRIGLVRVPPAQMTVEGGVFPTNYRWTDAMGEPRDFAPTEIVHFRGYDPDNPLQGLSTLETLRRTLDEDVAAAEHRRHYWRNAARIEGVIERPKDAGKWGPDQRKAFREAWGEFQGGRNSGKTPILEDGMQWKATAFSARDSELTPTRKLTREIGTASYHVPQPSVGILDHATFSNIREQHKQLYQDALGPILVMFEEEIELSLLPETTDREGVYVEFNISEKLKGSFEEQADSIQKLCGGPVMTRNEGRARLNLPSMDDEGADELVQPLNTATPSQGSSDEPMPVEPDATALAATIQRTWRRQATRLEKVPAEDRAAFFNTQFARWNQELADDLHRHGLSEDRAASVAHLVNTETLALLDAELAPFDRPVVLS